MSDSSSTTEQTDGESLDPAEAFSLLGEDRRLEIIATLDEASKRVPFSELQDRVGLSDSGQFNYHLSQLVGHFVSKSDEGYQLTAAGERLARAVAAGLYTDSPELAPFEVDGTCNSCGEPALEASYADERFTIACGACDHQMLRVSAPPSLVRGREPAEALSAFDQWAFQQVEQALNGLCPVCGGPISYGVTEDTPDGLPFDVLPEMNCSVCGRRILTTFAGIARRDPTVESYLQRRDPASTTKYYWELDEYTSDEGLELRSEDPFRMAVLFTGPDEDCVAIIDDSLDVIRTEVSRQENSEK